MNIRTALIVIGALATIVLSALTAAVYMGALLDLSRSCIDRTCFGFYQNPGPVGRFRSGCFTSCCSA